MYQKRELKGTFWVGMERKNKNGFSIFFPNLPQGFGKPLTKWKMPGLESSFDRREGHECSVEAMPEGLPWAPAA